MPQFSPAEEKIAIVTFPVSPAGLECSAELWLGSNLTKVATSGGIPFVSTGVDQSISPPVTMPGAEGTYPVYLDVFVAGQLVGAYQAIEDIIIAAVTMVDPSISRFSINWSETTVLAGSKITAKLNFWSSTSTQYKLEVCLLKAGVVKASGSKLHYVQYTTQGQIAYIDVIVPDEEGVYATQIRTYRNDQLTGIYPIATADITVYTVTEPSYLSYQGLTLLYPKYPAPIIWHYLDVECDIVNTANKTVTRTVTLWLKEVTKLWTPITRDSHEPGGTNAGAVIITLAPGASFHYHFAGQTVGRDLSCIELRDDYGGVSERLCGSW